MERSKPRFALLGVVWLSALAAFGSCRCEERIRDVVGRDNVQKHFGDAGEGSSVRREEEPNDVPEQATLVELGEKLRTTEGRVESADDQDWYSLRNVSGQRPLMTVRVIPESEDFDPSVQVELAPSRGGRISYDNRGTGEPERIRNLDLSGEVRRIGVAGGGSQGAYTLEFERQLTAGAVEREPNDARRVSTRLEFPGEIQGFYDRSGDVDWYHVLRQDLSPGIYGIRVQPTGSFEQNVRVFTRRKEEEPYLAFEVPVERPVEIPNVRFPETAEGVWMRFAAGDEFDPEEAYRLRTVEHPSDPERTIEVEPNDTEEESMGIELGERIGGYLHSERDVDRFELAVGRPLPGAEPDVGTPDGGEPGGSESGDASDSGESSDTSDTGVATAGSPLERLPTKRKPEYVVQVGVAPRSDSDRLALVRSPGAADESREVSVRGEPGRPVKLCNFSTDETLLDVEVRAETLGERGPGRDFTYELSSLDLSERVEGIEFEPNDRRGNADRLELGGVRTGYVSGAEDRDVYAFGIREERTGAEREPESGTAPADPRESEKEGPGPSGRARESGERRAGAEETDVQSVRVELRGHEVDLGFEVLDEEGALVAEVDREGAGADESTSVDLPPGLYFVRVSGGGGAACERYRLSVERVRSESGGQ